MGYEEEGRRESKSASGVSRANCRDITFSADRKTRTKLGQQTRPSRVVIKHTHTSNSLEDRCCTQADTLAPTDALETSRVAGATVALITAELPC